jgi:hypothetical protein
MKNLHLLSAIAHILIFFPVVLFPARLTGQGNVLNDTINASSKKEETDKNRKSLKMTTLTFGGNGVNLTKVNNQFTVMTGGRGSATFNNRYTLGGGGWGMTKGVEIESQYEGTYEFVKMGYGGLDFGYLVVAGNKFNLGIKILIGGGAVFKETVPKSEETGFEMFPVIEPTVYYQLALSKLFRVEMGASYRYVSGTDLPYLSDKSLGGFSFYIGFLVSACTCK